MYHDEKKLTSTNTYKVIGPKCDPQSGFALKPKLSPSAYDKDTRRRSKAGEFRIGGFHVAVFISNFC